jgi:hypothetical protein
MTLAKASLTPKGQNPIPLLFNPTQYSLGRSNLLAEIGVPGTGAPVLQYVRGQPRILSVELFFDTYEAGSDVRQHTDRIYGLLDIRPSTHVPPVCLFQWGSFVFRCVVEQVQGQFTLFLADGTPVRATLQATLKEYADPGMEARRLPTESSDHVKRLVFRQGDTLASLAAAEYGDPGLWREIARANRIDNPRQVAPGAVLVVPPLPGARGRP